MRKLLIYVIIVLIGWSCSGPSSKPENSTHHESYTIQEISNTYAKGFQISMNDSIMVLQVMNPWKQNETWHTYILHRKAVDLPESNNEVTHISIPGDRIVSLSATHIGIIKMLESVDKIAGIDLAKYIFDEHINQLISDGKIAEVGDQQSINIEKVLEINPDFMLITGYGEVSPAEAKLRELGISLVYNMEWMEESPLGRAEWIKFIGCFLDKYEMADSLFRGIEDRYNNLASSLQNVSDKPVVLHGFFDGGTWFIPGGKSYIALLYHDAGADYLWKETTESGSLAYSLEAIFEKGTRADYWFNTTMTDYILQQYSTMTWCNKIKAYRTGNLFANTGSINPHGGNDYWETGIMNPDILLKDLASIFHPDIVKDHTPKYFKKIIPNTDEL